MQRTQHTANIRFLTIFAALTALFFTRTIQAQVTYEITDLGALPGGNWSEAYGINNQGQIVGQAETQGGLLHAFLLSGGVMTDLGVLPGGYTSSAASRINGAGKIIGVSIIGDVVASYTTYQGFFYDGTMIGLGALPPTYPVSQATGINNFDQVTGYVDNAASTAHAVLFANNSLYDLGPFDTNVGVSYGINDAGQMVGYFRLGSGYDHAFLHTGTNPLNPADDLGALPPVFPYSYAYGINAVGQVVGYVSSTYYDSGTYHAFVWTPSVPNGSSGVMSDLGTLNGSNSIALGINANGQAVGYIEDTTSESNRAFVWDNMHGMLDLNTLVLPTSGWTLEQANDINDAGQIVGWGTNSQGQTHAYLLTPNPPIFANLTLTYPAILSRGRTIATVELLSPAPTGGIKANLSSSDTSVATVPASITIPAGKSSGSFIVTGGTVTSGQAVLITASRGANSVSATLLVNPTGSNVKEITLLPNTVVGGESAIGVVTLTADAPTGGLLVPLISTNSAVAAVPAYVEVAAGRNSVSFPITTDGVTVNIKVVIGAGFTTRKLAILTVQANTISSLALAPSPAEIGDTVIGVVRLALPAPAGGFSIPLASNNTARLNVDASVIIPAGQTTGTFFAQALAAGMAKVTADLNGVSTSVSLTITP